MKKTVAFLAAALITTFLGSSIVSAQPSPAAVNGISSDASQVIVVKDADGNEVETHAVITTVTGDPQDYTLTQEALSDVKELPEGATLKNQFVVDISLEDADDNLVVVNETQSVTVTLLLDKELEENDEVWVRHWINGSASNIEVVKAQIIDKHTVSVTLKGLSPADVLVLEIAGETSGEEEKQEEEKQTEEKQTETAEQSADEEAADSKNTSENSATTTSASGSSQTTAKQASVGKTSPKTGETNMILLMELLAVLTFAGAAFCWKKSRA